jgi:hypothetical protein
MWTHTKLETLPRLKDRGKTLAMTARARGKQIVETNEVVRDANFSLQISGWEAAGLMLGVGLIGLAVRKLRCPSRHPINRDITSPRPIEG